MFSASRSLQHLLVLVYDMLEFNAFFVTFDHLLYI